MGRTHSRTPPDTLLATMPGLQAEFAAKALTLEGMTCLLECDGLKQLRHPHQEPSDPLAVTWPVSIYVAGPQLGEARQILASIQRTDVIGDQWTTADAASARRSRTPYYMPTPRERPTSGDLAPRPEGTGLRFLILLALAGVFLLLVRKL